MRAQPVGVTRPGDAKHPCLAQDQQLHDQAAYSARRRRNGDRLSRLRRDRSDGGVRRHTHHVQRTRDLPTQFGRLADQLIDRDGGVGGMTGSAETETENLVTDLELGDPGATAVTTPARSLPSPDGKVAGNISCIAPTRMPASPGLIPAARTSTTTSPGPGDGCRCPPRTTRLGPRNRRTVRRALSQPSSRSPCPRIKPRESNLVPCPTPA